MIPELGQIALLIALALSVIQAVCPAASVVRAATVKLIAVSAPTTHA